MEKRYDVFISYSTQDQKVVEGICGFLEREGYRCFVAYRDIPRGVVWATAITNALDASKMMVVVFSGAFNMSKQTDREIEIASENDMPILTFRVAEAQMTGAKKYYLKNLNWIDAFPNPWNYFGRLLDSVVKLIGPSKIVSNRAAQEAERLFKEEAERKAREAAESERLERECAKVQRKEEKERSGLNENDGKPNLWKGLWIGLGVAGIVALLLVLVWPKRQSSSVIGSYNGYDYVDLGLPSGTLWATCNVGADGPESYGNYYAWGETSTKSTYNWDTYKYAKSSFDKLTKYCSKSGFGNNGFTDKLTALQSGDDPATANWGSGWQTPSKAQWDELLANTTNQWTEQNGKGGRLFTSKKNGQTLFLPAAGCRYASSLIGVGSYGYYWSSSLYTGSPDDVWVLYFSSGGYFMDDYDRSYGRCVRPVRSASQN